MWPDDLPVGARSRDAHPCQARPRSGTVSASQAALPLLRRRSVSVHSATPLSPHHVVHDVRTCTSKAAHDRRPVVRRHTHHPANRPSCDRTYTEGSMPPDKPTYKRGIGHRPQATCPLAYSITWRSTVLRARLLLPNCIVRARIPPGHVRAEQFGVLP